MISAEFCTFAQQVISPHHVAVGADLRHPDPVADSQHVVGRRLHTLLNEGHWGVCRPAGRISPDTAPRPDGSRRQSGLTFIRDDDDASNETRRIFASCT